jgi:hypothetical protein
MTDLTALTLMGRLAEGSAARHRWRVPSSTRLRIRLEPLACHIRTYGLITADYG